MKQVLFTLAVVFIGLNAYCHNGPPETPCTPTLDSAFATVCTGDTFYIDTNAYTHTGVYYDTLLNQAGCDSIIKWFVLFPTPPNNTITRSICLGDTVHFGDSVYAQTGDYQDTVKNGNCILSYGTLFLTVNTVTSVTLSWDSLVANGNFHFEGDPGSGLVFWAKYCTPPAIPLTGGNPPGGVYSGLSVSNDTFYAATFFGNGPSQLVDTISYKYCNVTAYGYVQFTSCEGISVIPGADLFSLYPNPADDYTTISFDAACTGATVFVKDITGRQLYQTQLTHSPQQIPAGNLPPGVYLVTMSTGEQVGSRLLVKE